MIRPIGAMLGQADVNGGEVVGAMRDLTCVDVSDRTCVLFDFDGTLADTTASIVDTARVTLAEWGYTEEQMGDLLRLVGPPFPFAWTDIYGFSPSDADEITRRYRARYNNLGPESHPLFDGMADLLRELKGAGKRLAVATSKRDYMVKRMIADDGVSDLFEVVAGAIAGERVQKSEVISFVLGEMHACPDDAVMVGDRSYDVTGANELGIPCVGVLFGTARRSELEEAGACAIEETVAGLGRVLLG